ncbi:MAG: YcjF family protein [Phycisphaerales bacterium]
MGMTSSLRQVRRGAVALVRSPDGGGPDVRAKTQPSIDWEDPTLDATDEPASLTVADGSLFPNPLSLLRGPSVTALLVAGFAIVALIVVSQVVSVLADISTLPVAGQYGVYALIVLAVSAIGYAMGRLAFAFARFKASPRYSNKAIRDLAGRAELREQAKTDLSGAAGSMATLLKAYPLDSTAHQAKLTKLGFKEAEIEPLIASRDELLAARDSMSPEAWIARYRTSFAQPMDQAAKRLIRRRSLLVGAKTAAVPHGGLDTAILLTHAYLMIADLCTLYQLRTNRAGTIALTWRIIVAAFVAGRLEDVAEEAGQHLFGLAGGATTGTLTKAGSAVAGKVMGKAAEGMVNAAFTYRLGRAAMVRLRPID